MFKVKEYRDRQKSYGDLLDWFALVADGVVETTTGRYLASWYYRGEDLSSSTRDEMTVLSAQVNSVLREFDGGWSAHIDSISREINAYPGRGAFRDRTTLVIDEERRQTYSNEGAHYETVRVITLAWEVPSVAAQKITKWIYNDKETTGVDTLSHRDRMLEKFNEACRNFEVSMAHLLRMRRMKAYSVDESDHQGREVLFDEQLEYYEYCATGIHRPVRLPAVPVYLNQQIGATGIGLESLLGQVGFGTGNVLRLGSHMRVRTLSFSGFPSDSSPAILAGLDHLGIPYRWNTRFIFQDQIKAENALRAEGKKWEQKQRSMIDQLLNKKNGKVDEDAVDMASEVKIAEREAKSNLVRYGHYTSVIVLMHTDMSLLDEMVKTVKGLIEKMGFKAQDEDINNADAFIGSLPGNRTANVRGGPMHTLNLADLMPLTSVWAGPEMHPNPLYPPNSPALLYGDTTGRTPFRVTTHVDDVGHTLVLGPTGAGKTVLLNAFAASHMRYPGAQNFILDRKYGAYVLCKASGGQHYDIGGPGKELSFCPLKNLATASDLLWATEWIEALLTLQDFPVSPGHRNQITSKLKQHAESPHRSLSNFVGLLTTDLRDALQHYTLSGAMGALLDAEDDELATSKFMVFEMEHLSNMSEKNMIPVLLYLFREIERRLDGSPTQIIIDESWLALAHPAIAPRLQLWLKTVRSKVGAVILATQEPNDVLESPIRAAVLAACPTRFLLPNPLANGDQRDMYDLLGCNETERVMIQLGRRKAEYYYKSPEGRRMFALGLGPVALAFLGATGKTAYDAVTPLIESRGADWPAAWLEANGQPEWANYWRNVK